MRTGRLEAFSDGVIAILITIMVLELPKPEQATWEALRDDVPILLAYLLSFIYIGIYWNNHHHLFQAVSRVRGGVLWANLHLLFWLSLVPFATEWMSEQGFRTVPVVAYGVLLLMAAIAYWILQSTLLASEGPDSLLARAVGGDVKGKLSVGLLALAIVLGVFVPWLAVALFVAGALLWLVPSRRVEREFQETSAADEEQ